MRIAKVQAMMYHKSGVLPEMRKKQADILHAVSHKTAGTRTGENSPKLTLLALFRHGNTSASVSPHRLLRGRGPPLAEPWPCPGVCGLSPTPPPPLLSSKLFLSAVWQRATEALLVGGWEVSYRTEKDAMIRCARQNFDLARVMLRGRTRKGGGYGSTGHGPGDDQRQ